MHALSEGGESLLQPMRVPGGQRMYPESRTPWRVFPPREHARNVTDSFDTLELTACSDLARNAAACADSGLVLEQESLKIPDPGDGSSGSTIIAAFGEQHPGVADRLGVRLSRVDGSASVGGADE